MTHTRTLQNPVAWGNSPGPLYQNEIKCSAFDMAMIFHSHANKTHFSSQERLCTWPHFEKLGSGLFVFNPFAGQNQCPLPWLFKTLCIGSNPRLPYLQTSTPLTVPHLPQLIL